MVAVLGGWDLFLLVLDILFARRIFVKLASGHIENGQVLVHRCEVDSLEGYKELITVFTDEAVVVLILNMDNELKIALFLASCKCLDVFDQNLALEARLLDVGQLMSCEQQMSFLLETKSVVL